MRCRPHPHHHHKIKSINPSYTSSVRRHSPKIKLKTIRLQCAVFRFEEGYHWKYSCRSYGGRYSTGNLSSDGKKEAKVVLWAPGVKTVSSSPHSLYFPSESFFCHNHTHFLGKMCSAYYLIGLHYFMLKQHSKVTKVGVCHTCASLK